MIRTPTYFFKNMETRFEIVKIENDDDELDLKEEYFDVKKEQYIKKEYIVEEYIKNEGIKEEFIKEEYINEEYIKEEYANIGEMKPLYEQFDTKSFDEYQEINLKKEIKIEEQENQENNIKFETHVTLSPKETIPINDNCNNIYSSDESDHLKHYSLNGNLESYSIIEINEDEFKKECEENLGNEKQIVSTAETSNEQQTKPMKCKECHKVLKDKVYLLKHLCYKGKQFTCDICNKSFTTIYSVKRHKVSHEKKALKLAQKLKKQEEKQQERVAKPRKRLKPRLPRHKCDICNKLFTRACRLRRHKLLHEDNWPYHCEHCPKKFKMPFNLKLHQQIHFPERKMFQCKICTKKLSNKRSLNEHVFWHNLPSKNNNVPVIKSDKERKNTLNSDSFLKNDFESDVCSTPSTSAYSLKTPNAIQCENVIEHKQQQENKTYSIDEVKKWYKQNEEIQKTVLHLDQIFECEICNKPYPSAYRLKRHKSTVHVDRLFECLLCSRKFKTSDSLKLHRCTDLMQILKKRKHLTISMKIRNSDS